MDNRLVGDGGKVERRTYPIPDLGMGEYNSAYEYVKDKATERGIKYDTDKPRLDLIPPEAITALGMVLTAGAQKYESRNWEKGMGWGRVFAASMRHLWTWWGGQKTDPETGYSHLWHALCNIVFLITYEARGVGEDDRVEG